MKRLLAGLVLLFCACGGPDAVDPGIINPGTGGIRAEGRGNVTDRFTAELWVHGNTGYTTTWGNRTSNGVAAPGNAVKIWNVAGATPVLVDSVIIPGAGTLGDIQASADGRYLVVATEPAGSLVIFDLADPLKPRLVTRYQDTIIATGVHTAEVQAVNGKLHAFLSVNPGSGIRSRLVILDISNPAAPVQVLSREMGAPFIHDVFVRDGILMTALWNDGITIFDIGGGGRGGSLADPVQVGNVKTAGGKAHNIHWFHDPVTGSKRYAFVGEEGPASIGISASGDVHVVDVSDMANPREVAFFNVPGAGAHNFSADEQRGILYAAFYNGGVRALNARGDLSACTSDQRSGDGRCDLAKMGRAVASGLTDVGVTVFVWGVQFTGGRLYASDMLNGLWRLSPASAP